ncbi:uncharacterized protein LOC107728694 isoform X1 [Sinocyclocheilus rhinocerous]|uniref:Uncharacterized LOC107728694 n=1 Tax=Sinocyclocheilus rhinocerous TaxID=307959 RepID=A0A673LIW3_9TELE|nr:PREDICTED: uncharacterized protein LOC107728694 isoform X1 [Sinocyclocheilus rhinocerous]
MTNNVEDQTPVSRKDVFVKYLQYYDRFCCEGDLKVCSETQVTDEARRVLLLPEEEPRKRFNTPDFYETLYECAQYRDCQRRVRDFKKAAELLEMFCVNLFLFPWKKEIKTLKTFTGHFVYYIKPVLPFARSILQIIGYCMETDTEYKLSDNFDPDKAKSMGFDLFLVRLECEYLLELMNQRSHVECLEIIQTRAAPLTFVAGEEASEPISNICNLNEDVFKDDGHVEGGSLVSPGEEQQQESLKSHNPHDQGADKSQDSSISDVERPSNSFMTDDKSILEMQKNYPDLAIRQKPIFRKSQRSIQPLKAQEWAGSRGHNAGLFHEASTDMSGPQSIAIHTETTPGHRKLHIPNALVEAQPSDDKPLVLQVGKLLQGRSREGSSEDCLAELTEQMGKMHMKELSADEPLKYPIEETAQAQPCSGPNDVITAPPTKSPDGMSLPILCSPSQEPVCNITGCGSCVASDGIFAQDSLIKEPPQSIYIPSALSACPPVFGPPTDHNEGSNGHKSPTPQQPEDDLVQTYVVI